MPQAFQARKFFIPKTDPKQEVYKPVPYYFGTLSTQDAADQIAEESSLTKGDVLNVLDRYQRYVIKNLQKGYKVELLGFGTVYNRFVTEKGEETIAPAYQEARSFSGGVASNSMLRERMREFSPVFAEPQYSTDNAMGIAVLTALQEGL